MEIFYNVVFTLVISSLLVLMVMGTFYAGVGIILQIVDIVRKRKLFNNSKKSNKNG